MTRLVRADKKATSNSNNHSLQPRSVEELLYINENLIKTIAVIQYQIPIDSIYNKHALHVYSTWVCVTLAMESVPPLHQEALVWLTAAQSTQREMGSLHCCACSWVNGQYSRSLFH